MSEARTLVSPFFATVPHVLTLLVLAGCSDVVEYGDVTGYVTGRGKPQPEVEVRFSPEPGSQYEAMTASSFTNKDGQYRLFTRSSERSGAVVGHYRVCIVDPSELLPSGSSPFEDSTEKSSRKRVPPALSSPDTTPFRQIEVKPGSQVYNIDIAKSQISQ